MIVPLIRSPISPFLQYKCLLYSFTYQNKVSLLKIDTRNLASI